MDIQKRAAEDAPATKAPASKKTKEDDTSKPKSTKTAAAAKPASTKAAAADKPASKKPASKAATAEKPASKAVKPASKAAAEKPASKAAKPESKKPASKAAPKSKSAKEKKAADTIPEENEDVDMDTEGKTEKEKKEIEATAEGSEPDQSNALKEGDVLPKIVLKCVPSQGVIWKDLLILTIGLVLGTTKTRMSMSAVSSLPTTVSLFSLTPR
jgi:flagellar biosynthesis GTPase FlhF